jgi:Na+/proline symporter
LGIIIFTGIALFYVLLGGIRAVIWTDVFQGVYFGGFVILVFLVTVFYITPSGNVDSVWSITAEKTPNLLTYPGGKNWVTGTMIIALVVFTGLGNIGQPAVFQRFFMAKSVKTIRTSAVLYGCIIVPLIFLLAYLTFAGLQVVKPDKPDMLMPLMLTTFTPVLAAFFIAGAIAAGMSTVDSLLISLASMITIDYPGKLFGVEMSQKSEVTMGRVFIVILIILAYILSLNTPAALYKFALLQVGFSSCVLVPLIGPMLWSRASAAGAIAALIVGPVSVAVTSFWIKSPLGFNANMWGPTMAIIALVVVSLLTTPVKEEHQAKFKTALGRQ